MSEKSVIQMDNSQTIALELTNRIVAKEKMGESSEDFRKDYLNLYAECLDAARGSRMYPKNQS